MFDIIVVGAGLFGTAAARHLSKKGANIAIIGPKEPKDPKQHEGVFSSHYDQSRIVRRMTRDLPWAILTDRSINEFNAIQNETGIPILFPRKGIHIAPSDKSSVFFNAINEIKTKIDVPIELLPSAHAIEQLIPQLKIPNDCHGIIEHEPAGYINPRQLIRAQLQLINAQGAEHFDDIVTQITSKDGYTELTTRNNKTFKARKVLITTGAYANSPSILPKPLDIRVKTESLILAEISQNEFARLGDFPTLSYEYETDKLNTIYMPPPLLYPDGKYYIKMGCNTLADRYVESSQDISSWIKSGNSDPHKNDMVAALRLLIPNLDILSVASKRCIITYTPNSRPMIDRVDNNIFVATGGNGLGAKACDGIGALAADVVMNNRWVDNELNAEDFAAKYLDPNQSNNQAFSSYGMARND